MISHSLATRVLDALAVSSARCDAEGLATIYGAWCRRVAFDNVQKRIWLRDRIGPMPGDDASAFFEGWLQHGTGGTCWATSGALCALLRAAGFDARRAAGAMMMGEGLPPDERRGTHGTVLCDVSGETFLVDTHVLTGTPLPYRFGERAAFDGPGWARLEHDRDCDVMRLHFDTTSGTLGVNCFLHSDRVSDEFCTEQHLRSETASGFNAKTFVRKRHGHALVVVAGGTRREVRADGDVRTVELGTAERVRALLELGYSEEIATRVPADVTPEAK